MEKASRRPMGALTVVMPTVWAERVISSIGMFVVFVQLDSKALLQGVWASFPLGPAASETSKRFWDEPFHIMYDSPSQPSNGSHTIVHSDFRLAIYPEIARQYLHIGS